MSAVPRRSPVLPANGATPREIADSIKILETLPALPNKTPASASASGYEGEVCYNGTYLYCYLNGAWKRAALATW